MFWVIDTDAGVDDAIGIGMPFAAGIRLDAHRDFRLCAVTTVTGNVHVTKVNRNVGAVLDVLAAEVPIFSGCDRPMLAPLVHAEEFHGADGLGDAGLSKTDRAAEPLHAACAIAAMARRYAGDFGIVALGPLTNIALACNLDPDLPARVTKLVVMGCAWQARGNQTPAAEFNIAVDPESARVVFDRFSGVIVLPWEVSLDQMMPFETFEHICAGTSARAAFFAGMTRVVHMWKARFGFAGVPLPDPLAVAVALDEGVIADEVRARVHIDIGADAGRGLSALDVRHPHPNARIVTRVHADRAWEMIVRAWR